MDADKIASALIAKLRKAKQDLDELLASLPTADRLSWAANKRGLNAITLYRDNDEGLGDLTNCSGRWVIWMNRLSGFYELVDGCYETELEAAQVLLALTQQLDAQAAG